jgi:hypothetical protein
MRYIFNLSFKRPLSIFNFTMGLVTITASAFAGDFVNTTPMAIFGAVVALTALEVQKVAD